MALPVFAEYMHKVYADTLESGIFPTNFNIPKSVDVRMDCGELFETENNNFEEEEL